MTTGNLVESSTQPERPWVQNERLARECWVRFGSFAIKSAMGDDTARKYILDMFPFPSGSGLHMGHVKGYAATDVLAHFYRRNGHEVLHPMGWDSFGLPAETAAIKEGIMPQDYVDTNIKTFKRQMEELGLIYDWEREIKTSDPEYFHWTQQTFLDMLEKGLAYYSNEPINWCEECATTLANEDLEGTVHDRCGTEVTRKLSPQWAIDMRSSADRLLENLYALPEWERGIVEAQIDWIGKTDGYVLSGGITKGDSKEEILVFLPKRPNAPQTISGASHFIAISPQKALELADSGYTFDPTVKEYIDKKLIVPKQERRKSSIATDYTVTIGDHEFQLHISEQVTDKSFGAALLEHTECTKLSDLVGAPTSVSELEIAGLASPGATYEIQDWVFSRQRYWGEPIPVVRDTAGNIYPLAPDQLPLKLPEIDAVPAGLNGQSPLAQIRSWVEVRGRIDENGRFHADPNSNEVFERETDTMPNWAGSSGYFKRYLDPHNNTALVSPEADSQFPQVDIYVGGMEHATRHLIYARFWNQFLHDNGTVTAEEPFKKVQHVGLVLGSDGRKMSKSKGNGVNPSDMVAAYGADATRMGVFEMGDFAKTTVWDEAKISAANKFLERVWKMKRKIDDNAMPNDDLKRKINETIDAVNQAIESFKFGNAVSRVKGLFNTISSLDPIPKEAYEVAVSLLQPFAPHIAEALLAPNAESKEDLAAYREWPEKYPVSARNPVKTAVLLGGKVVQHLYLSDLNQAERRQLLKERGYTVIKDLPNGGRPTIVVSR